MLVPVRVWTCGRRLQDLNADMLRAMGTACAAGHFNLPLRAYTVQDAAAAYASLAGRTAEGKVVLSFAAPTAAGAPPAAKL